MSNIPVPGIDAAAPYPLPRYSNRRRTLVDDRTPEVAIWAGNDHAASIIRLEPPD